MDRSQAEELCRRYSREHPDRVTHRWVVRQDSDDSFAVVKVTMPPGSRLDPLKATVESTPKPPQPEDPRASFERNIGGWWA